MYAGFWRRLIAHILDVTVLYFLVISIGLIRILLDSFFLIKAFEYGRYLVSVPYIISLLCIISAVWLYYAVLESSKLQGTLGKRALGIIVVDEHYRRISFGRAAGRYWSKIVSVLTFDIGFIMAAFTKHKQALHDMIANTYVVDKKVLEMSRAQYLQYPPYPQYPPYSQYPQYPQYPEYPQNPQQPQHPQD
ncbi:MULTISPECIES: RDD family protein [Paenibacillus]|uniref:RDD domain-containing protein n=1 Tax=Paenibacillus albilobatus TaxID=2716884 RepID=A0A920CC40_9BACL|nr:MULTISPECIES: RDD family protein [Paenibacillus]GIO31569.1 hypothetical protein J2TS6_27100 [Paenibacillus albilobatus]